MYIVRINHTIAVTFLTYFLPISCEGLRSGWCHDRVKSTRHDIFLIKRRMQQSRHCAKYSVGVATAFGPTRHGIHRARVESPLCATPRLASPLRSYGTAYDVRAVLVARRQCTL